MKIGILERVKQKAPSMKKKKEINNKFSWNQQKRKRIQEKDTIKREEKVTPVVSCTERKRTTKKVKK